MAINEFTRKQLNNELMKELQKRYPELMQERLSEKVQLVVLSIESRQGKITVAVRFVDAQYRRTANFEYQNNRWYCTRDWND